MFETVLRAMLNSIHSAPLLVFIVSTALSLVLIVFGWRCAKEQKMFLDESAIGLPWIAPSLSCSVALMIAVILVNIDFYHVPAFIATSSFLVAIPLGVVGYVLRSHLPYFDYQSALFTTMFLTLVLIAPFEMGYVNYPEFNSFGLERMSPILIVQFGVLPSACVYAVLDVFQFRTSATSETTDNQQTEIDPIVNKSRFNDAPSIEKHIPKRIDYRPEE